MLSGLRILVIGSSHLASPGYLVSTLHDSLQNAGAQVHSIGVCGLTPAAWLQAKHGLCGGAERVGKGPLRLSINRSAKTTPISELVQAEHPDLVVIVMGDTLAGYAEPYFPKQWASQEVWKLTSTLEKMNVRCAWVGPAWGTEGGESRKSFARAQLTSEFLSTNVKPCTYVDSLKMSKPGEWPTFDGQHFMPVGYKAWGTAIAHAIDQLPK